MRRSASRVLLDVNAIVALCEDDVLARAARLRARKLVRLGRLGVLVGHPLLQELSGLAIVKPRLHSKQLEELATLSKRRVLRRWLDRVAPEARRGGLLPDRDAFEPTSIAHAMFDHHHGVALLDAEAKRVKTNFEAMMKRELAELRIQIEDPRNLKPWATAFRSDPDSVIDSWCTEHAYEIVAKAVGEEHAAKNWPAPRKVPSLRADVAYHLARQYLAALEAEGKARIEGNDAFDNMLFVDAVYADLLVTNDKGLRRTAARAGRSGVRVQDFDSWAQELTRGP